MNPPSLVRVLIIDDEPAAVLLLREMLGRIEGIELTGQASNIEDGLNLILTRRPDIIFLDIRLSEESGFDLIRRLKDYDIDPFIVMVTGYSQFGLEALKAGAFDYLLKPVDPNELLKVVSRYRQKFAFTPQPEKARKIRFNTLSGFILVNPDEILYCEADANYSDIIMVNLSKYKISQNLGSIDKILPKSMFFRISRSAIINLKYLAEINRGKKNCVLIADENTTLLPISQNSIKDLEKLLI